MISQTENPHSPHAFQVSPSTTMFKPSFVCHSLVSAVIIMTTYYPGSLADLLHHTGFECDSKTPFVTTLPKMALSKFQQGLQECMPSKQTFWGPQDWLTMLTGICLTLALSMKSLAGFILLIEEVVFLIGI